MHIFLTGATGYIGKRLLPVLIEAGHHVTCSTRSAARREIPESLAPQVSVFEHDFLEPVPTQKTGLEYDAAYYLIHSMAATTDDFTDLERKSAQHFRDFAEANKFGQVIYLSGMVPEGKLSKHLESRKNVSGILGESSVPLTGIRYLPSTPSSSKACYGI